MDEQEEEATQAKTQDAINEKNKTMKKMTIKKKKKKKKQLKSSGSSMIDELFEKVDQTTCLNSKIGESQRQREEKSESSVPKSDSDESTSTSTSTSDSIDADEDSSKEENMAVVSLGNKDLDSEPKTSLENNLVEKNDKVENEEQTSSSSELVKTDKSERTNVATEIQEENQNDINDDDEVGPQSHEKVSDPKPQDEKVGMRIPKKSRAADEQKEKSSLIASMPRNDTSTTKTNLHGFTIDIDDEEEESDENDEEENEVSISNIVRETLGRSIRASSATPSNQIEDEQFRALDTNILANTLGTQRDCKSQAMKDELTCPICHEIFYCPVSMICGHTFCKDCLNWWISKSSSNRTSIPNGRFASNAHSKRNHQHQHQQHFNCPTCRKDLFCDTSTIGINTALRACITFLFTDQVKIRVQRQKEIMDKLTRGENGGAHLKGFQIIQSIDENDNMEWTKVRCHTRKEKHSSSRPIELFIKRNVLMDDHDQRMCLSLAVRYLNLEQVKRYNNNMITLELCLITMEEDEADEGIPFTIDNDEDLQLIVNEERFDSKVEMKGLPNTLKTDQNDIQIGKRQGTKSGISHRMLEGTVVFDIDLGCYEGLKSLSFVHIDTGAQLQILLPLSLQDYRDDCNDSPVENEYEYEFESENEELDYYENDGFVVDDNEESMLLNEDDGHDVCCICHDGGDLIVCDGGDDVISCGKTFHVPCINRSEVPEGDWVCKDCAGKNNITVGIEGHEYPPAKEVVEEEDQCNWAENDEKDGDTNMLMDTDDEEPNHSEGNKNNITVNNDGHEHPATEEVEEEDQCNWSENDEMDEGQTNMLVDSDDDEPNYTKGTKKKITIDIEGKEHPVAKKVEDEEQYNWSEDGEGDTTELKSSKMKRKVNSNILLDSDDEDPSSSEGIKRMKHIGD